MRKSVVVFLISVASAVAQKTPTKPVPSPVITSAEFATSIKNDALELKLLKAKVTLQRAQDAQKQNALNWYAAKAKAEAEQKEADEKAPGYAQAIEDAGKVFEGLIDEAYTSHGYAKDKYDFDREKLEFVTKKAAPTEKK